MIKISPSIAFCCCVFFSQVQAGYETPGQSENDKRSFMESLARPLPEGRTLYRWLSKQEAEILIGEGEWTRQSFRRYMTVGKDDLSLVAGAGLYVSEDTFSSSRYGPVLIEVEVEDNSGYLDLSDDGVIKELRAKGVSVDEVYKLNPAVAVKYTDKWWVLKDRKGVKFSPFVGRGLELKELEEAYVRINERQRAFFKNALRDTILKIADQDISVFFGPFMEIMEWERGRGYVAHTIGDYPADYMTTVREGINRLKYTDKYLTDLSKRKIMEQLLTLPVTSMSEGAELLLSARDSTGPFRRRFLSVEEITSVVEKTPLNSVEEGKVFLMNTGGQLNGEQISLVVEKILPHFGILWSAEDIEKGLLSSIRPYISESDEARIKERAFHISLIFPEQTESAGEAPHRRDSFEPKESFSDFSETQGSSPVVKEEAKIPLSGDFFETAEGLKNTILEDLRNESEGARTAVKESADQTAVKGTEKTEEFIDRNLRDVRSEFAKKRGGPIHSLMAGEILKHLQRDITTPAERATRETNCGDLFKN